MISAARFLLLAAVLALALGWCCSGPRPDGTRSKSLLLQYLDTTESQKETPR